MPFHSIVVPTYNQDKYISAALDSIMSQTDADWEAIVVNDGSTDSTREIIEAYAKRDSRIKCIHQENGGVARALNTALQHVTGEWIHWLSSDDLFEPTKLSINRRWIAAHPQSSFFFSYFTLLRESTGDLERRDLWGPVPVEDHQILTLFYRNYISGISICVRRTAWEDVGFFDPALRYAQDYDQWLRLLQRNKATFVSEWTVISRNHAEQGSETFPAACYFDTSKAAIRFLNEHPFHALVPHADLTREETALKAVSEALDVACEATAFIYAMGAHPALILRILEWVYSASCEWPAVRELVEDRVRGMAFEQDDSNWSWMWKQLALSLTRAERHFAYQPVNPVDVALREWESRIGHEGSDARSLSDYLSRFDNVEVEDRGFGASHRARIALLSNQSLDGEAPLFTAARQLLSLGLRPVILAVGDELGTPNWSVHGGVAAVSVERFDMNTLPWLGDVDLAVYFDGIGRNSWLGSLAAIDMRGDSDVEEFVKAVFAVLNNDSEPVRPVVFLERVLTGGGAERVVLDLTRHLDRRRYKPEIWTMFEEHNAVPDLGRASFRLITQEEVAETSGVVVKNMRGAVGLGQKIYHRMLSERLRERLAVGKTLRGIWRSRHRRRIIQPKAEMSADFSMGGEKFSLIPSVIHHQIQAQALGKAAGNLPAGAVVIAVMEEASVAAWMAQAEGSFPYVASLHTMESLCIDDIYKEPKRIQSERWFLANACQRAGRVTVPSAGCKDDLVDVFKVGGGLIDVVPNPVDCSRIRRQSFQRLPAVQDWVRKSPGFRLVHVGRLDPQKNHELLFLACRELMSAKRDFSLALVGDGWARPALEKRIAELGLSNHITLIGEQENPAPWIAAADALALTSHFEAFGLVLVEAMICGTPVVSVDCPVGPSDVLGGGNFGMLVDETSPGAFAQAISTLMDSPGLAQQLREKGYERALAFDVKQIVPAWERLIDAQGL
ncbi:MULTISPECIES: glycosyltransferase [unclassified Rhizobium]|uniref:glycosyltransferase n=1 Tax=unclassified Rhizobium TaxID=2613769 RepID=UPI0037FC48D8